MIFLVEDKGLVRVESWAQIIARPAFRSDLDPRQHELKRIIGQYEFRAEVPCGLSTCHTPHLKGFLVETKDGLETNIGKICGRTIFGVDFETLTRTFERYVADHENRSRLHDFAVHIDALEQRIQDIRKGEQGADWVYRKSRPLLREGGNVPTKIVRAVADMIRTGSSILKGQREATQRETEQREMIQRRKLEDPLFVEIPIAEIQGIAALREENNLRTLLVLEIEEELKAFSAITIDSLGHDDLRRWAKWTSSVPLNLARAEGAVADGRRLLTKGNLQPFDRILDNPSDRRAWSTYMSDLPILIREEQPNEPPPSQSELEDSPA